MSMPPTAPRPPSPAALRRLLRGIAILAAIALGGYCLLIAAWVLLNPRW